MIDKLKKICRRRPCQRRLSGAAPEKLADYPDRSPKLSGGDIDAAWEDSDVGEESVGGGNPTPDQSVVEELGEAMGITYQDNEPLGTEKKLERRDEDRWELNPASAEDFGDNE
ncbi:MAG: hypothetical protein IPP63_18070 [Chloracidobacterium sp.]|nr:hypothetical protein [Chloracidobacterium sp.]